MQGSIKTHNRVHIRKCEEVPRKAEETATIKTEGIVHPILNINLP